MSRRRVIELEEIPTLKQAYEEGHFSERNLTRSAKVKLLKTYEHNEEFNKKLSLIQADITKLKVDAIVNAANETLLGGGGVDGAIHRAAGHELRNECWDLNGCDTGDAKITKGYELPAKHVIHTVGPVGEKPHLLRSAYVRSMEVMTDNNLRSIAFSNISTGVYGYPRVKAGQIALDTIRNWMMECTDLDKLDRIIFCVFEDDNKDVYETLFPLFFPPPPKIDDGEKEEEDIEKKNLSEEKKKEVDKHKEGEETHATSTSTSTTELKGHIKKLDKDEGEKVTIDEQKDNKENIEKVDQDQVDKEKACFTEQKDGKELEGTSQVDKKDETITTVNEQEDSQTDKKDETTTTVNEQEDRTTKETVDENDTAKTKISEQETDKERIKQPKKAEENQDADMTDVQRTNIEESDSLKVREAEEHKQGDTTATEKSSEKRIGGTEQQDKSERGGGRSMTDGDEYMADAPKTNIEGSDLRKEKEVNEHKQGGITAKEITDGTEDVEMEDAQETNTEKKADEHKQDDTAVTATGQVEQQVENEKVDRPVDKDDVISNTNIEEADRPAGENAVMSNTNIEKVADEDAVMSDSVNRSTDEDVIMSGTNIGEEDKMTGIENNQNDVKNEQHAENNLTTKPEYNDTTDTSQETISKSENVQEKSDGNTKDNEKNYGSNHHASL